MRHHIVTRIVVSLVVLWAAAVVVFAWGVTRPVAPRTTPPAIDAGPSGEALFARHCAMCHDPAATGLAYRDAADRDAASAAFRAFLVDHYGPSPEGIRSVVEYVMEHERR